MNEHAGELGADLSMEYGVSADDCHWNGSGAGGGQQEQGRHLGLAFS